MRSALLCVFFAFIVHKEGGATTNEDFKPTPIPLNEWHGEKKDEPAGTLQEVIATDIPASVAAIPAHYWEDALRHSVYLTLVRDKIDQLIAKGSVISPDSKIEPHATNEIDDHNLWEKIKTAPFDRLIEDPSILGDITIMSKGRLLEEKSGYRFTEDKSSKDKCNDEKCMDGVKAFWSVKRVRQRDAETTPGKYHYELTFAVNSQPPKKHKKPYDNPVRTFTVREGSPVEQPQYSQPPVAYAPRPQRAVWLHKNIVPTQNYQTRKTHQPQGLDRFFLSLFSSDEDEGPPRHKPNPYVQKGYPVPQHSKLGYTGAQTEQHQHKKLNPYPYKPMTFKYSRPPLGPPPSVSQAEHHYTESDKLKIQFAPPQVQFNYPDSDVKTKSPITPPQIQPQYIDSENNFKDSKNPYHQIQPINIDSDKTKTPYPQIPPQYLDSDKTEIPFSQQVQHYLDDVKAKHPYPPQTKYRYDVKSKVQPPVQYTQQHQHHYREPDAKIKNQYPSQPDYRYQPSNVVKTTRPVVLPTPPIQTQNISMEVINKLNVSEITTKEPEIVTVFKPYPKPPLHRPPQSTKISYFPEHVRPPVFNAPPGVFVTMDKKPFKPMPPLKHHHQNHHPHSKPAKTRPVDFRPSPQVVDVQLFSDPDPLSDAFRPMAVNYAGNTTGSSETNDKAGSIKYKHVQHKNLNKSKPPKKHELIKSQRTTTSTPDIITAQSQSIEESDSMNWANNLLSAFVKTTPMVSHDAKNTTETTTPFEPPTTTETEPTTTVVLATTTEVQEQEKTTTTPSPKKRTRPPPKFTKPSKLKKHKRTSTTTTTTSTTTTTEKPRSKRPTQDLTPQASSAASGTTKPSWQPKSKISNETTTAAISLRVTNATTTTTTARPITTSRLFSTTTKVTTTKLTTTTPSPTPETEPPAATTQPKNMNRFRISTLMHKGTSVNHDKWSMPVAESNKTRQSSGKYQQRRKGSNFQGYVSSTPTNVDENPHKEEHIDLAYNSNAIEIRSTTEMLLEVIPVTPEPSQPSEKQNDDSDYPIGTEETEAADSDESDNQDDEESKDHNEFIFSTERVPIEKNNEIHENQETESIVTTPYATVKNKTKCKKKKHMNLTTTEDPTMYDDSVEVSEINTTTVQATTEADIFQQIFGGFTVAGLSHANKTKEPVAEGSENRERLAQIDDDLEDFLDSLESKKSETNYDQYDEEESEESDYSPFNNEEESRSQRHADVSYEDYRDRPYSFLELMAME